MFQPIVIFSILINFFSIDARRITFKEVPKNIYDNIHIYFYPGPTINIHKHMKLADGLNLVNQPLFDKKRTTVFIFHGFGDSVEAQKNNSLLAGFIEKGDENVVFVSYHELVRSSDIIILSTIEYIRAERNAVEIGEAIGQFLKEYSLEIQSKDFIHLISISLGGQIMTKAARTFGSGQLWLTALDPSGSMYLELHVPRLNSSDGSFVEIVHTNAGVHGDSGIVGMVNFWINGGIWQPGCNYLYPPCSHLRSQELYREAILNERSFPARKCDQLTHNILMIFFPNKIRCDSSEVILFGPRVDKSARGHFYFKTRSTKPYSLGAKGLEL